MATTEKSFGDRKFKSAYLLVQLLSGRLQVWFTCLNKAAFYLKSHYSRWLSKIGLSS